ncbi:MULTISPECIES: hypothetical protein [unclassified Pseudoalteromonas]|uniref:hypothetical protein n=1 Tax=unclassified Pseudoalteromonas TaxID=194690 RepID=UPI001109F72C|nr:MULTISPECIES: hypothetical protein [unclassified Pseudoalteromonas]MCO7251342.1 hypothetical protein [Pseudoalteromonas sp. Ps84H-4]TMO43184.1 hypothetical protein CWC25_13345 [Pseudoalteromonas sp. S4389]
MVFKILGWFIGVNLVFAGFALLISGDIIAGLILLLAAVFCIPPLLSKMNKRMVKEAVNRGKSHNELTQGKAIIAGGVLFVIAAVFVSPQPKSENKTNETAKVVEEPEEGKSIQEDEVKAKQNNTPSGIDLIAQLMWKVDELENWFIGPFEERHKRQFYDVKNNYDEQLDKICGDFDALVKSTGNLNSDYYDEALACRNFKLSLVHVINSLNQGAYSEIPKIRAKFEPEYQNLKKQVDEYRESKKSKKKAPDWYVKSASDLVNQNASEWHEATSEEKLSMCANVISKFWLDDSLNENIKNKINSVKDIKPYAEMLVIEMDNALDGSPSKTGVNPKLSESVVTLMIMMEWLE